MSSGKGVITIAGTSFSTAKLTRARAISAVPPPPRSVFSTARIAWAVAIVLLLAFSFGAGWYMAPKPTGRPVLTGQIPVGAILALTGDLATFGTREKAAVELAEIDINEYLARTGANFTIKVLYEDTETKPDVALQKLQSLAARGVKAVVGPLSSGEIRNIKGYADSNRIVIVSQSSTAVDLSVPGDFVFRLVTDDIPQGRVLGKLLYEGGIRYAFLVYRGDTYGDGLAAMFNQTFTSLGGRVLDSIRYNPDATSFSVELSALNPKVQQAIQQHGADKVAVELIAFEEAAQMLMQAQDYADLLRISWYGCDGTAMSSKIVSQAGAQAAQVGMLSTIFTVAANDKFTSLRQRLLAKLGEEPDEYAYLAYDCLWVIALSMLAADQYDGNAIRLALPYVANSYFGASGWTKLNANGDRAAGDYAIYAVVQVGGTYDWVKAATYSVATDTITWHG